MAGDGELGQAGGRSPFLLFRVDDRLLHGQVSLGWGGSLRPRAFVLADDVLARDPDAAFLYEATAPEGTTVEICRPAELAAGSFRPAEDPARTFLLVRSLAVAAELLRRGLPGPVNLGGLHLRPGAHERLPFLFLTPEDEQLLRALVAEGYALYAQDLPGNPRRDARDLLGDAPEPKP